jgi:hypothetical protein
MLTLREFLTFVSILLFYVACIEAVAGPGFTWRLWLSFWRFGRVPSFGESDWGTDWGDAMFDDYGDDDMY